ncbi:MAG: hypothetical protein QOH81_670 [Sphingomonadales bacterium]|jgi:hypothetical protein|nr:hypothetical protein [Sphingomonadales bacterium]
MGWKISTGKAARRPRVCVQLAALLLTGLCAAAAASAQSVTGPVAGAPRLALPQVPADYRVDEYFLSGTATSYRSTAPLGADGAWSVAPAATAPFTTRVVTVRPADPRRFNGNVVVEWLNVTGGADTAATWSMAHRELVRSGYAFVGVSAQMVGIEPNPTGLPPVQVAGKPLKVADPQRYAALHHPGDAFSYDIFTQAARAVRSGALLGGLRPRAVLGAGSSQSSAYLVTYIDAIDPLARAFDGYLPHVRGSPAAPLDGNVFLALRDHTGPFALPYVRIRNDVRVPVLTLVTEFDLMNPTQNWAFRFARQPDGPRLRTWEVTGASHADIYFSVSAVDSGHTPIADLARAYAPTTTAFGQQLPGPANAAPQGHYVYEAAIAALSDWIRRGKAPPASMPIEIVAGQPPSLALDASGNALGGVRTPWVDVPTARYSGVGYPGLVATMLGRSETLGPARLTELYPNGRADYRRRFSAALRSAIRAGVILPADEAEIMALADASYPSR